MPSVTLQPVAAQVGPRPAEPPMLHRAELLTLATFRSMLEVDARGARSRWMFAHESVLTAAQADGREVHAALQAEMVASPGDVVTCGAPSTTGFTADWTLRARTARGPATVEMTADRHEYGCAVSLDLLDRVRDRLVETLTADVVEGRHEWLMAAADLTDLADAAELASASGGRVRTCAVVATVIALLLLGSAVTAVPAVAP